MNKKLLAVAVAGALSPPVVAFAQSSVTLYGVADLAYVSKVHKTGAGVTTSRVQGVGDGAQAGNRIGFRGTEDLGGGMSALFTIEQGVNLTRGQLFSTRAAASGQQYDGVSQAGTGNMGANHAYSTATNRQSFVGLKGGWGELTGGYQYTTLYQISTLSGYFVGTESVGGEVMHFTDNANFGGTRANGLIYKSPVFMDGFQVHVQKGAGASSVETAVFAAVQSDGKWQNHSKRWSFSPTYNKGPLSLALGYTRLVAQSNGTLIPAASTIGGTACLQNILGVCVTNPGTTGGLTSSNLRSNLWQLAGSYVAGPVKYSAQYLNGSKKDDGIATIAAAAAGIVAGARGGADVKSKGYMGSIEYTSGKWRPFLLMGRSKQDTTASGVTVVGQPGFPGRTGDYKDYQYGLRYDLSKRAMLYFMSGQTRDTSTTGDGTGARKRDGTAFGMWTTF